MANQVRELMLDIAASLFISPCSEADLLERDFLKNRNKGGIQRLIMMLEKEAIYYKGEIMHIKLKWAKKNLREYELDLRSEKEKELDGLTDFAKQVLKLKF